MLTDGPSRAALAGALLICCSAVAIHYSAEGSPAPKAHYVSSDGRPTGSGGLSDPWDLATALAHPAAVRPGDTIWLRGGRYRGAFTSTLRGTESRPITVRAYPGERAVLDASTASTGSALEVRGDWAWYWGLEVTGGHRLTAVDVAATGTRFINMSVYESATGFHVRKDAGATELYGNLVHDNGRPEVDSDAGVLIDGEAAVQIVDNIAYGQKAAGIRAGTHAVVSLVGNAVFNNGVTADAALAPRNIEIAANRYDLAGNHTYYPAPLRSAGTVLGGKGTCGAMRLADNTFADGVELAPECGAPRLESNRIHGRLAGLLGPLAPSNLHRAARAAGIDVSHRPNRYEPNRQMIVVHNWDLAAQMKADVGSFLRPGDTFSLWRAGDPVESEAVRGEYSGGPLRLPMSGAAAEFGVFVLSRSAQAGLNEAGSVPTQQLKLWLRADAGITLNGSTVSQWADQSGNGTHAVQAAAASQPTLVAAAVNGKPAISFDGGTDFMTFPMALNGLNGMTIVMVGNSTYDINGTSNGVYNAPLFWNETAAWGAVHLSPFQRVIPFRFGTGQVNNLPVYTRPATIGTAFSITTAMKDGTNERLYVNGSQVMALSGKLPALANIVGTGTLGRGYNNTYFNGRIAEVLVYHRALTDVERQGLETYLAEKYVGNRAPAVNAGPDAAASLAAPATLSGTVSDDGLPGGPVTIAWSKVSGPGTATFADAASAATTVTFSAAGLYVLRLSASDGTLSSTDDLTLNVVDAGPLPFQDLKLWLKADTGITLNTGKVAQWTDQSGSGANAAQAGASNQPAFVASAVNGRPALAFDGADDFMTFNLPMTNLNGATIFLVAASTSATQDGTSVGATQSAIFWNENADWSTIFLTPFQRYVKYQFGTGQANNISTYTRPVTLGTSFSVNAAVKNGANEALYVNGSLVFSAGGKLTPMRNSRPTGNLGRGYNDNTYFSGRIAEVLVYTRGLSDAERQQVESYLLSRYSAGPPPVNQAPTVNAGPDQTINILQSASLAGSAGDDGLPNGTLTYAWSTVSGPGTVTFAAPASVTTTASFSATGAYTLRLTANDGAASAADDVLVTVNAAPPGTTPTQELKLWLKADQGVTLASGKVSGWTDQSGNATNAAQAATASQPAFLASAFGGRPALQFDGVDDFLTFNLPLNGLSAMTIVLVSASTSSTQNGSSNGATNSAIFWNETSDWCTVSLSPYQRVIRYHFGTGQAGDLPSYTRPASIGSNYSTTTLIKNGPNEALYVDGAQVSSAGGKLTTMRNVNPTGNLGRGYNNNTYFAGQIAEVLVYAKALTDAERQSLDQYLLQKYPPIQPAPNQAPTVNAGPDQTVGLFQTANLSGSVNDDGLPGAGLTTTWSLVSGPGTVSFGSSTSPATTANFSAAGVYTLRLSASDTLLTGTDELIVTVNAPPPGSIPQQDLKLWLKADQGVTHAAGQVSQWSDQSGVGNHAVQATAGKYPLLVTNAVNGLPAIQFDGVDDFLAFNLDINTLSGMSVFLVSASTSSAQDGSWHGATHSPIFWNETSDWSTTHVSPYQRVVKFRFGTGQGNNLPAYTRPASIGSNFSVTAVVKNGATENLYVDGAAVMTATGKLSPIRNTRTAGSLGRGYNDNTYFAGRIAEVLVFTRALTEAERTTVQQYLSQRYPPAPGNQAPVVNAGPDQSILTTASAALNGTVTDDDLPNGVLTTQWTKVSGPGTVTFASASSRVTSASFSLAGTYVLRLTASDSVLSASDDVTVTVNAPPPDLTPPVISNVQIPALYSTSVTITWRTDEPADSQVFFGPTASYGSSTVLNTTKVLDHSVTVGGLQPETQYHFSVRSADASGNASTSADGVFTTTQNSLVTSGLVGQYSMSQAAGRPTGANSLSHPSNFENWFVWVNAAPVPTSSAVTPNFATAPDGTQTADKIVLTAPRGLIYHPFVSAAPSQTYTFSVYLRTVSGTFDLRLVRDNTDCWCGTASPTLTVTNTWQRYSLTFSTATYEQANSVGFGYEEITPWNLPASGEVLAWGAQLEPGSSATPIPALLGAPYRDQAVTDLSGRNNHGWLGSTPNGPDFTVGPGNVWTQHDPVRKTQSLYWDGTHQWVQVADSPDLNLRTQGTWTVLVKPEAGWKEWSAFLNRATGPGTRAQYALMRYNNTNQVSFYTGNDNHPYRGGNLPTGVWSVVTVTLNAGVVVGYIDAAEIFRFTNVPTLNAVTSDLRIGTYNVPPAYNFRGDMGAVLLYNRALSAAEVGQNAAALKAGL